MASAILHRSTSTMQLNSCSHSCDLHNRYRNQSLRFVPRGFDRGVGLHVVIATFCSYSQNNLHLFRTLVKPAPSSRIIASSAENSGSTEAALILLPHGESMCNENNMLTGCIDVPLTEKGVEEAIKAGRRISNIPLDIIYTSSLIRAQMTAMLAMTQHSCRKVPIIVHDDVDKAWRTRISSKENMKQSIPVITAWQLDERMYGDLQGLSKQETAERYGAEEVHAWCTSYDIPPPYGESLKMCAKRTISYFRKQIEPKLQRGMHVFVSAHGISLRSIIMYLDSLTQQEVNIELSTGVPLVYIYKNGNFLKMGSPVRPTEARVYVYSKSLKSYRQNLVDERSP